jgi:23S rRNA (adenine2503-C2)-methyltransferase
VNLAISLHAPNDGMRTRLMPVNDKYKIAEVLDAAFANTAKTGRQLMIEYMLLNADDFSNHTPECAEELAALVHGRNVMVNLIPWNPVKEREFAPPSRNAVHNFQDILIKAGIHTRIRRERGQDIGSACGQLRITNCGA